MILVLGGTTEGRLAVKVLDESGKPYFTLRAATRSKSVAGTGSVSPGAWMRKDGSVLPGA